MSSSNLHKKLDRKLLNTVFITEFGASGPQTHRSKRPQNKKAPCSRSQPKPSASRGGSIQFNLSFGCSGSHPLNLIHFNLLIEPIGVENFAEPCIIGDNIKLAISIKVGCSGSHPLNQNHKSPSKAPSLFAFYYFAITIYQNFSIVGSHP